MKSFIALIVMVVWSVGIYLVMQQIGFSNHMHDWLWSLGATVMLFIGIVGNVWIFFLIVKEAPWQWFHNDNKG